MLQRTMPKAPQRTPVPGPAFIRLLARLADADIRPSPLVLSERLSQWIDWNRAVALSKALDGRLPDAIDDAPGFDRDEESECARVRTALVNAIADMPAVERNSIDAVVDYTVFRERYLDLQRTMQAETGRLRGRLRDRLTQRSAELARLAEVDAVMELTLSPREQTLLATVPVLLGKHFDRLHEAGQNPLTKPPDAIDDRAAKPGVWLDRFRQDLQSVLLAELELRFHPVEGLLEALRTR
jgi:hypothetical protein